MPLVRRLEQWRTIIQAIHERYEARTQRALHLFRPRRFTEKMQWRKLFDLDPVYTRFSDKLAVRSFVAERLGEAVLLPLLWTGDDPEKIPLGDLPRPYIIKWNHGSGFNIQVREEDTIDAVAVRQRLARWKTADYGRRMLEPGYIAIPRRLIVEPLVGNRGGFAPEYKFLMFDGRVRAILVRTRHGWGAHDFTIEYYDDAWRRMPFLHQYPSRPFDVPPPPEFVCMREIAETLSRGRDFLRVDLLVSEGRVYVGEITCYHLSGYWWFDLDDFDYVFGDWWRLQRPVLRAIQTVLTRDWGGMPVAGGPVPATIAAGGEPVL